MNGTKTNLYLLTGFYGSGKTTVLMRILDQVEGKRVGVIQSEHGDPGQGIDITEDIQGSLCCICPQNRLLEALQTLSERHLDDLFVESSSAYDLSELESAAHQSENSYELRGVICLIDANHFMEQNSLEAVKHQLRHCHLAVINKADLVSPELLEAIKKQVKRINPSCEIVSCSFGGFSLEFLQNGLPVQPVPEQSFAPKLSDAPVTYTLNCMSAVQEGAFKLFLDSIKSDTYRIKGFFNLEDKWLQIDGISAQIDFKPCEPKAFSQIRIVSRTGEQFEDKLSVYWDKLIGQDAEIRFEAKRE